MTDAQPQYRFSTRTLLVVGSLCVVLGAVVWLVGGITGTMLWLVGFLVFLVGIPVLTSGLVRESREKRSRTSSAQR